MLIIPTTDGSNTIALPNGATYHSHHGAVQESIHVFIQNGLAYAAATHHAINILEVGFGTGLNFLLTADFALAHPHLTVEYTAIEPNFVSDDIMVQMDYAQYLKNPDVFYGFLDWYIAHPHTQPFTQIKNVALRIHRTTLDKYTCPPNAHNLVYYDAFGSDTQPEMWLETAIAQSAQGIMPHGVWVSYAAKGVIKRTLQAQSFKIEKLQGAPGKHEMMRGVRSF